MQAPNAWPRLMRPQIAAAYVGGYTVLQELQEKYGLTPMRRQRRLTLYLRDAVDAAINLAAATTLD